MDFIKNWILTIVFSAVSGSVTIMLCPDGNIRKAVKTVISIILLLSFILPFKNGKIPDLSSYEHLLSSESELDVDSNKLLSDISDIEIEKAVSKILTDNLVEYNNVEVVVSAENNEIKLEKIIVDTDEKDKEKIHKLISDGIGNNVSIEVRDD